MRMMKFKSGLLLALITMLLTPMAWAGGTGYARLTAYVSTQGSAGRGLVYAYADNTTAENTSYYGNADRASAEKSGDGASVKLYAYAYPNFGYKFANWSTANTSKSDSGNGPSTPRAAEFSVTAASQPQTGSSYKDYYVYARFDDVRSEIKDIYLCKGDKVTLYFYNNTKEDIWTSRVNGSFLKSGGITGVASFSASSFESTKGYSITVAADRDVTTDDTDELTVMDYAGNVYHYRVHVAAAREVFIGGNVTHECNSVGAAKNWSASSDKATVASVSPASATAGQSVTATITGVGVGNTTIHVSDYNDVKTTGALGAAYDLAVTVVKAVEDRGSVSLDLGANHQVTDITGVTAVSSTVPTTAAVSRDGDTVTITGGAPGTATVDIETATKIYRYTVTVTASAMNITLCVGDEVKFNYDLGDVQSAYAQYRVYGDGAIVSAVAAKQGAASGDYSRGVCLTIKALKTTEAGSPQTVELQTRHLAGGDMATYEKINVTVLPARLYEVGETEDFQCLASSFLSGRGKAVWDSLSVDPAGIVTASYTSYNATSAGARFVGAANGTTTVTAKNVIADGANKKGVEYNLKVTVIAPHVVTLAQGDHVRIWYNNTALKTWSLILNGETYESGKTGQGHGFDAEVKTGRYEDSAAQQSYIDISAERVSTESDLIIVTDGDNYYAYRMTCGPERVVKVGDTVQVTCRTVSTYEWAAQVGENSRDYVSATCPPHDSSDSHGSTVSITGLGPTDAGAYAYVQMHNEYYRAEEVNAQGAIYQLACKVVGGPIVQVHLSAGAFLWSAVGYWAGTNATYTVTTNTTWSGTPPSDKSQVGFKNPNKDSFTCKWHTPDSDHGLVPQLEIAAKPDATKGDWVVYTIWAGDEKVVTYLVNVTTTFERMIPVGQTAEGFLYGSTEPWVSQSSDPDICETQPTIYQKLYSSKAIPKRAGDVLICSTNPVTKADYWGIVLKPYEIHEHTVELEIGQSLDLVLPKDENVYDPALVAPWRIETAPLAGKVTAELTSGTEADATRATVHITAGTSFGSDTLVVGNTYYQEKINVRVVDDQHNVYIVPGKYRVQVGSTTNLNLEISGDWTAESEHPDMVEVLDPGVGSSVTVRGVAAGESVVTVVTDDTIYFVTVEATRRQGDLPELVLWVDQNGNGQQLMTNLVGKVAAGSATNVTGIRTDDNMIADVMAGAAMGMPQIYAVMAKQEGRTWIHVQTSDSEYLQEVVVKLNHIDKQDIQLVYGRNGTRSTLKEKFYEVISYSNLYGRTQLTLLGNEITIEPNGAPGMDQVFVECYQADYPDFKVTVHYWIEIDQRAQDEILEYEDGYIAYRGVSDLYEDDGDIVMVFTNVDENGRFTIPEGLTARIDMLAIGGGGGGSVSGGLGTGGAGGGGAGGFNSITNKKFQSGTFTIAVGAGGESYDPVIQGMSLAGGTGFDSYLTNQFGYVFIMANGGGGGGAPDRSSYEGLQGASGGGGAWNGQTAGAGGRALEGQGTVGGTPEEFKCGGGGGGAGGQGGADQSAGPGRTSSISGTETLYSVGGAGGRLDVVAQGQPGSGIGFGGDGGSNAIGGRGADGIVVLRMTRLFKNILVPIPTTNDFLATLRTEWTNGVDVVPFPYEERQFRSPTDMVLRDWTAAIDHVTGSNFVHCCWGEETVDADGNLTTNKVGVGYYSLNVYLKDGYAWDDGTQYGSTEYMRFNWVVTEDINNVDARVEVSKTIIWEDDSPNAIVRINTSASPEMSGAKTPEVLFIGGLCGYHDQEQQTVVDAVNAVAQKANVDYYLLSDKYQHSTLKAVTGSLVQGGSITKSTISGSWQTQYNHFILDQVITILGDRIVPSSSNFKKYDYIVFEFDGNIMAATDNTTGKNNLNALVSNGQALSVANALMPFYNDESVIWIIPAADANVATSDPFRSTYYQPSSYWRDLASWVGGTKSLESGPFYALASVLDPKAVINGDTPSSIGYVGKLTYSGYSVAYKATSTGSPTCYRLDNKIANQVYYDNSSSVVSLLESVIKVKPFDIAFKDKIMSPASGLSITGVTVNGCSKPDPDDKTKPSEDPADWKPIIEWTPAGLDTATADGYYGTATTYPENFEALGIEDAVMLVTTNNEVKIDISNCTAQVWTRFDTHVHDDGTFCTSENAEYNQQTGKFEKNPNDGPATVGVIMGGGGQGMDIDGNAETSIPWRFEAFEIRGHVYENLGGDVYVGGARTTARSFKKGLDVPVYYRAWGGYRLTALRDDFTDHNSQEELEEYATCWTFNAIDREHDVYVTFTPYFGDTASEPATYQYDATAHVYPVELIGWEDVYETEVRYSPDPYATEDSDWLNAEDFAKEYSDDRDQTCVGEHMYWYRVFAYQPGYGTNFNDKGWVWVDTGIAGSNVVTITKAPLVVTANSFKLGFLEEAPDEAEGGITINYGDSLWRGVTVDGLFAGDEVVTNGTIKIRCPTYAKQVGQYELMPTYADGKTSADVDPLGNYTIEFRPGGLSIVKSPMVIGGVSQFGELDADDPFVNTGVPRVEKTYDGKATNIVVRVDKPTGVGEGEDFHIRYSTDGVSWSDVNPQFEHAGTNKVWYSVTSGKDYDDSNYFYVTNFSYVIVNPAEIELTSASATKGYDGTALTASGVELTAGELFGGDTFTSVTSGTQTDVGSSANAFTYELVSADANVDASRDYRVKKNEGTLTVTYASIKIGDVTHPATTDPTQALDYGKTGVEDVEVTYDGTGWNVQVNVGAPVSGAVVHYTMTPKDLASWSSTLAFTNVGEYVVYFAVDAPNYASVTNFAKVTIKPYPVTVTADDQYIVQGEEAPAYTATVGQLALRDRGHEAELITYPAPTCPTFPAGGETIGQYPIVFNAAETVREQGNYVVTFAPGTLFIDETARVASLWIVDHENCDDGSFYLAFKPTLSSGELAAGDVVALAEAGKIKVAFATDEDSLKSAEPFAVELRDPTGALDIDKGWIWVKVSQPIGGDNPPALLLWQVTIDR